MDADKDRGLLGERQKTLLLTAKSVATASCLHWLYVSHKSPGGNEGRLTWMPTHIKG